MLLLEHYKFSDIFTGASDNCQNPRAGCKISEISNACAIKVRPYWYMKLEQMHLTDIVLVYMCYFRDEYVPISTCERFYQAIKYPRMPDFRQRLSSATRLGSTACNFVSFVSTVMKIADNMQNIVVKYVPEFGIDCIRSFCVILFCPRVLGNPRFVRFTRIPSRLSFHITWNCPYR